jgi:hypothetical protein
MNLDAAEVGGVDNNANAVTVYPSQTVQKTLVQLIEAHGGLHSADLTVICDSHPHLFGEPGSLLRRGVQFKVRDWKRFPARYTLALSKAFRNRPAVLAPLQPQPQPFPEPPQDVPDSDLSDATIMSSRRTPPRVLRSTANSSTTPGSASRASVAPVDPFEGGKIQSSLFLCVKKYSSHVMFVSFPAKVHYVDITQPECDGHMFINLFKNAKCDGCLIDGFGLLVSTPYKEDAKGGYSVTIYPSKNAIIFTKPSVDFVHRHCRKASKAAAEAFSRVMTSEQYAYIEAHQDSLMSQLLLLGRTPSRQVLKLAYFFPATHPISNTYFSGGTDMDGEKVKAFADFFPLVNDATGGVDAAAPSVWVLKWFIKVHEDEPRHYVEEEASNKTSEEVAVDATMEGMNRLTMEGNIE